MRAYVTVAKGASPSTLDEPVREPSAAWARPSFRPAYWLTSSINLGRQALARSRGVLRGAAAMLRAQHQKDAAARGQPASRGIGVPRDPASSRQHDENSGRPLMVCCDAAPRLNQMTVEGRPRRYPRLRPEGRTAAIRRRSPDWRPKRLADTFPAAMLDAAVVLKEATLAGMAPDWRFAPKSVTGVPGVRSYSALPSFLIAAWCSSSVGRVSAANARSALSSPCVENVLNSATASSWAPICAAT